MSNYMQPTSTASGSSSFSTFPYMQWETSRTILRRYHPADEGAFLSLWSDPVIQRWSFFEDLSPSSMQQFLRRTIESMDNGSVFFVVVEDKERHEVLGHVSLNFKPRPPNSESRGDAGGSESEATVGIALKARYRGRGFGTEVMHWLITYGFRELGLRRISLTVLEDNIPALRMYKKM
jgi:RimJ/RimL family protein N-acetyltransferase